MRTIDDEVSYKVVELGRNQEGKKLVSSDGCSFCVKRRPDQESRNTVLWRCSLRNKNITCKATVSQRGQQFVSGKFDHCHPGPTTAYQRM